MAVLTSSSLIVGSSKYISSPTTAFAKASRISGVGSETVSDRTSMMTPLNMFCMKKIKIAEVKISRRIVKYRLAEGFISIEIRILGKILFGLAGKNQLEHQI